jgi:short-subunit dehydrogenase
MPVIAVAGGSGGVGKTIVEKLLEEPKFDVVLLSRSVCLFSNSAWQTTDSAIY